MSALTDAVAKYTGLGWSVIPLKPKDKKPRNPFDMD